MDAESTLRIHMDLRRAGVRGHCLENCARTGTDPTRYPTLAGMVGEIETGGARRTIDRVERDGEVIYRVKGAIDSWFGVDLSEIGADLEDMSEGAVRLLIDTPGGVAHEALSFFEDAAAARERGVRITAESRGLVASAGVLVWLSADERLVRENSTFFVHDAWNMFIGVGSAAELRADFDKFVRGLDSITASIRRVHSERTGMTLEETEMAMAAETYYDADEALAAGIATASLAAPRPEADARDELTPEQRAALHDGALRYNRGEK